jgi:hypothetical protein
MKVAPWMATLLFVPALAGAHHSSSAYDSARQIDVSGVVREFHWTNPHTWIYLLTNGADGKEQEWRLEGTSLVVLARAGWRATTLKPGDHITAHIAPAKSGDPSGVFSSVTISDTGVVLSGGLGPSPGTVPPPPAAAPPN